MTTTPETRPADIARTRAERSVLLRAVTLTLGGALLGAVAATATAPAASAAPVTIQSQNASTLDAGRLMSPFVAGDRYMSGWGVESADKSGDRYGFKRGAGSSTRFSFPGPQHEGPIKDELTGACLEVAPDSYVTAAPCSDSGNQLFVNDPSTHAEYDQTMFRPIQNPTWGLEISSDYYLVVAPATWTFMMNTADLLPAADSIADVSFTAPESGAVVGGHPMFTGTGEPKAAVELLDNEGESYGVTEVDDLGAWRLTAERPLIPGPTTLTARQTTDAGTVRTATIDLTVVDEADTPIIDPMVAVAAGGVLALELAGTTVLRRRLAA